MPHAFGQISRDVGMDAGKSAHTIAPSVMHCILIKEHVREQDYLLRTRLQLQLLW